MISKLPKNLNLIRDQIIEHVLKSTPLPENLNELIGWYEVDGWDELVPSWEKEEHIALNLNYLSWLKFSDSELIANQEDDEPITDKLKVKYARKIISETLKNYDGYECPSVQAVEIKNSHGEIAVLGWLIEIHGQGGPVPIYQGAFTDRKHFYKHLEECNFLLDAEAQNVTDETILDLWTKPSKPVRSIIICAEWGYEQYKCPMSERTWKRIVQGKLVRRVEPYIYEGKKYKSEWVFNSQKFGSLLVTYDDDGVAFDGDLRSTEIWDGANKTSWINELMKKGSSDNLLNTLIQRSSIKDNSPPPYDYWIVSDSFVCEPSIGGQLKGEVSKINLSAKRLLRISQDECDALMNAVFREEGTYPDS